MYLSVIMMILVVILILGSIAYGINYFFEQWVLKEKQKFKREFKKRAYASRNNNPYVRIIGVINTRGDE